MHGIGSDYVYVANCFEETVKNPAAVANLSATVILALVRWADHNPPVGGTNCEMDMYNLDGSRGANVETVSRCVVNMSMTTALWTKLL